MKSGVAVLGAGGIGRHHANWWHGNGTEVVAILGRSDESVAASAARLKEMFGFEGRVYTDLTELLERENPEIVDVCTPAEQHFAQAEEALLSGSQVLCEKPFVFDHKLDHAAMMAQAERLAAIAEERDLKLGLCSQFSVAARNCALLQQASNNYAPIERMAFELRSPERGRKPNARQTWIDLGPHLVAALQTLLPDAEPDWETLKSESAGHLAGFAFEMPDPAGNKVEVEMTVSFTGGDEVANVRRITLQDNAFDLLGEVGPEGVFQMRYRSSSGIDELRDDPMNVLIREFYVGIPSLDHVKAVNNQRLLLRFLEAI